MKSKRLAIKINKPRNEVFDFVTDPANTPKWVDFIVEEKTDEWPPKLGTIYKNQDRAGEWRELQMTEFEQNKMFVMSNQASGYHVRYTLKSLDNRTTELCYEEFVDKGELEGPFTIEILEKLKSIIEQPENENMKAEQ